MEFNVSGLTTGQKSKGQPAPAETEKVLVLGAGPAGLAAALYAARAELSPLVLTGTELGGQASLTNVIENYPGFPEGVGGAELGDLFKKQAERFGARFEFDGATAVDLSTYPFQVKTYSKVYSAKSLIIATGASPTHLNVPGEEEFTGRGVSYCATCDGWFFKGKRVVVVGGGDSALEEGIFLTRYASSVNIIHRRDELRAGAILSGAPWSTRRPIHLEYGDNGSLGQGYGGSRPPAQRADQRRAGHADRWGVHLHRPCAQHGPVQRPVADG